MTVDNVVSLSSQSKRKRQGSFTGVNQLNTPLSMSSPSKALPKTPYPAKAADEDEQIGAKLQAVARTPVGKPSLAARAPPALPDRPGASAQAAATAIAITSSAEEGKDYF